MADFSEAYILIAIVVLAILVLLLVLRGKQMKTQPSRWAFLAFFLVLAGILFSENRLVGYGLMGAGVLLAVIDIIVRYRNQGKTL
jgi:membrane-bound ClpP family serine protease